MMFEPPNLKPPSKFDKLLDKIAVPILSVVIGSVLGAWLFGKILIVDFNWVMLGLGMVTTSIVAYYVIYSIRTKKNFEKYIVSLKDEHDKQITSMRQEVQASKGEYQKLVYDNTQVSEEWRESFRQAYQKDKESFAHELKEHLDSLNKVLTDGLAHTDQKLIDQIKYYFAFCTDWDKKHMEITHEQEQEYYKQWIKEHEKEHSSLTQNVKIGD